MFIIHIYIRKEYIYTQNVLYSTLFRKHIIICVYATHHAHTHAHPSTYIHMCLCLVFYAWWLYVQWFIFKADHIIFYCATVFSFALNIICCLLLLCSCRTSTGGLRVTLLNLTEIIVHIKCQIKSD